MNVPLGWENRHSYEGANAPEQPFENKAAIWKRYNAPPSDSSTVDDGLPVGWGERPNGKTLMELSMSGNSSAVAAAEVSFSPSSMFQDTPVAPEAAVSTAKAEDKEEMNKIDQCLQTITVLSSVILKMDERMRNLEGTVETKMRTMDNKLDMLLTALQK